MLENTFIHIQGVGPRTEQAIWKQGLLTWEAFLHHRGTVLSRARDRLVQDELERSLANRHRIAYFSQRLKGAESWRLFDTFRTGAAYLDIETSGGYDGFDDITMIGLYDGRRVQTFVQGVNLEAFEIAVSAYDLLITFNGAGFDLPFIRKKFPGITLPPGHIDLRFVLRRIGLKGGLKAIEKEVGLDRDEGVHGLDGRDAVLLWAAYQETGDRIALDRLIRYNAADVVNLEPLMEMAARRMKKDLLPPHGPETPHSPRARVEDP